jgi:uncharacterized protein YgiM (DUF1202 family)
LIIPTNPPTLLTLQPVVVVPTFTSQPAGPVPTSVNATVVMPTNPPFPAATIPGGPTSVLQPTVYVTSTMTPPATFTPAPTTVAVLPSAQVCSTCGGLRLRETPGSAGNVVTFLPADTQLSVVGRTADNVWVQVSTADGQTGWVSASFLTMTLDLNVLSVTGSAVDAPPGADGISVVSGISSHARDIFLDGLAKGNSPHVFTRVGDSITASPYFLISIGAGNYNLGGYSHLLTAIRFFSYTNGRGQTSFLATSIAARNAWGTTSVLDPANSDPTVCRSGETPLACEYRVVRPSVALIMFGTNDSGGLSSASFQANMQRIVQISIDMGVIPVLSTIPPKHYNAQTDGRIAEFNQIIIATAINYDIPLWNYWQAMSTLPGEGLAPDGVHPSVPPDGQTAVFDSNHLQYGFPMRNLTALQVLYALWQQVLYDGDTVRPATQVPAATPVWETTDPCPGAPAPQLQVGGYGRVTPGLPNKVRSSPSLSSEQTGNIPGEGVFTVLDGPVCADGLQWWQVNYNGLIGWTADGSGSEYWVEPY